MDAVGLGTPKDGDIPLPAPQKPADYYVVLLGTPQEPDGSPAIIAQSVEFRVLQCLPGEQGCAPAGTDTRWFYDTDAIGSVRLITDDAGGTFARYDYAPFGEPTLAENPDNQRRFAGKEFDAESRLNYFGARYFVAELGRFSSVDPGQIGADLADPQRWNAYGYARQNPLRYLDPFGLDPCTVDGVKYGECPEFEDGVTVTGRPNPFEHRLDSWFSPILVTPAAVWVAAPTPHVGAAAPLPWYEDPCVHTAMWDALGKVGVDAIGFIPESGGIARVIGHQAGYVGAVADHVGHSAISAVEDATRTVEGINGLSDRSSEGLVGTGLAVAGFVPGAGQVVSGALVVLDLFKTAKAIGQCR